MSKLAVLVSGAGTILEAILANSIEVSLVLADRPCRGLTIAENAGIPAILVKRGSYGKEFDRLSYSREVVKTLQAHSIEFIAMAGFMTILDAPIFDAYAGKIINTHPSLLPAFRGEHAVADTLAYGARISGCTIHIATISLDNGPILAQEPVRVLDGDTVDVLQERIKQVERRLYPATIRELMTKAVKL